MDKQWYKDRIYGFQCRTVSYINDNIRAVPKRKIIAECYRALNIFAGQVKLDRLEYVSLQMWINNTYRMMIKNADISRIFKSTEHTKNDVADRIEFRKKHDYIYGREGLIETARNSNNYSPFFLCSTHKNPAKDHKDWEGLIYYDEDWEKYISTEDDNYDDIKNEISKLYSIQYILGAPVFLGVRKNCTHFFTNIPIDLVLRNNYKPIMSDNNFIDYDKSQYYKYYQKVKFLKSITNENPQTIKEAKTLMKKWGLKV